MHSDVFSTSSDVFLMHSDMSHAIRHVHSVFRHVPPTSHILNVFPKRLIAFQHVPNMFQSEGGPTRSAVLGWLNIYLTAILSSPPMSPMCSPMFAMCPCSQCVRMCSPVDDSYGCNVPCIHIVHPAIAPLKGGPSGEDLTVDPHPQCSIMYSRQADTRQPTGDLHSVVYIGSTRGGDLIGCSMAASSAQN